MGKAMKIIRRSIHAFSQNYHSFASIAALFVAPAAAAILLSQSLTYSSTPILGMISLRLGSLFAAAGFPSSSQFFSLLNYKLSQGIFTYMLTFPFTLTFLILAKASIFQIVYGAARCRTAALPPFSSILHLYASLLLTCVCNSFVVLSANAAVLSALFLAFNLFDILHLSTDSSILVLSAIGVILYSLVLANAMVICNMGVVVSAAECRGGYLSILKAIVLLRGKMATAISLALPANIGIAATEALFQYRVVKPYRLAGRIHPSLICEASSIIYMYSILTILDTIITCNLFKSCKTSSRTILHRLYGFVDDIESENKGAIQV